MILALSTPDRFTRLWLYQDAKAAPAPPLAEIEWESGRALSNELLSQVTDLLKQQPARLEDLTGIVAFTGPGSFTSLRIGLTVANALADGLGIPVQGSRGENWLEVGLKKLATAKIGIPATPYYGAEANITKPKS